MAESTAKAERLPGPGDRSHVVAAAWLIAKCTFRYVLYQPLRPPMRSDFNLLCLPALAAHGVVAASVVAIGNLIRNAMAHNWN